MMVSRDALEKVVKEDMAGIWNVLTSEEKRVVIDNFTIHNYSVTKSFTRKRKLRNICGAC